MGYLCWFYDNLLLTYVSYGMRTNHAIKNLIDESLIQINDAKSWAIYFTVLEFKLYYFGSASQRLCILWTFAIEMFFITVLVVC